MIFDPSTTPQLKPWLVRTLEPICDAEPGALADYILALLKHNVAESEMRKELSVQLEEFLEKECPSFIDTLFTVLRTKSYLPYATSSTPIFPSTTPSVDTGIPIPLDGLISPSIPTQSERTRKRSIEHDEHDGRPPSKGPRLSGDGQSRYMNGRGDGRSWQGRGDGSGSEGHVGAGMMGLGMGMDMDGTGSMAYMNGRRSQAYRPPDLRRGICRDYHNNGYCARGALCKYSHGDDAVVPGQFFPMNGGSMAGMPFMPMFPGMPFDMGGGAYDPNQARMDMRPPVNGGRHMRAPLLPRIQQEDGKVVHPMQTTGELPVIQDLTPQIPQIESTTIPADSDNAPQPIQSHVPSFRQNGAPDTIANVNGEYSQPQFLDMSNSAMEVDVGPSIPARGNGFRGRGYMGRGRGGVFGGEVHNFQRPERRKDKTLVVEKIPADKLTLDLVNGWFKQFGTVTNVAVDVSGGKALVSFSTHEEAHAAWKAEEAVFGNRFVKVFWHRPMEGQGQVGTRMLAASAHLVANTPHKPPTQAQAPATPTPVASTSRKSSTTSALAAKQQLLEQQIAEQKSLMASLASASAEEKKTIMARLRKLGEEMSSKPAASPAPSKPPTAAPEDLEKERLDKELEALNSGPPDTSSETTEDLKAKLEQLKAEAASLGISEHGNHPPSYGGYRPYRGRGRGAPRSYYRGAIRGGGPRTNLKLDNRPKKLLVKGVKEHDLQAVRDWYETTGQLESAEISEGGDVTVSFRSRAAAEQGLAKGTKIPTISDPIQISWYSPSTTKAVAPSSDRKHDERALSPEPSSLTSLHLPEEEEVVASGWGGGDAEDGMGML
ncbi:hypothetical protein AB1N83_000733 [Pleurotus pulmonarius]